MKKKSNKQNNIILAFGLFFIVAGILLLSMLFIDDDTVISSFAPIYLFILGAVVIYFSLVVKHNTFILFVGLNLFFSAAVIIFTNAKYVSLTLVQLWPIIAITSGVALFFCSFYNNRRMRAVYFIPAFVLICLGIVFLLFSLNVINVSFAKFISISWPVLLILSGAVMMGIYFYQKNFPDSFPYPGDDPDIDSDNDISSIETGGQNSLEE